MNTEEGLPAQSETMIFGGGYEYQERYHTWDEAVAGHAHAVARVTSERPR